MTRALSKHYCLAKGKINMSIRRKGIVHVSDAAIHIEDKTLDIDTWTAESVIKSQLLLRLVAYLKSQGWSFHVPYDDYAWLDNNKSDGPKFAERYRKGIKDGLEVEIGLCGSGLEISFWEDVANHEEENSKGGRYIFDKESKMPYRQLCRIRATKLKIINFLTQFHDFIIEYRQPIIPRKSKAITTIELSYKQNEHVHGKGVGVFDVDSSNISDYNSTSSNNEKIQQGSMIWVRDYSGRWIYGRAFHNINNMWWVVCGKWDYYNVASFHIHTQKPSDLHVRVSPQKVKDSLNKKIQQAVSEKDFLRAHTLQMAFNKRFQE